MNFLLYSSMMPSTRCSSAVVPRTVVTRAWVSPRWKIAEPWARGSSPTSHLIDRRSLGPRPSGRLPSRISSRTTRSSTAEKAALMRPAVTGVSAGTGLGAESPARLGLAFGAGSRPSLGPDGGTPRTALGRDQLLDDRVQERAGGAFRSAFITICLVWRSCSP